MVNDDGTVTDSKRMTSRVNVTLLSLQACDKPLKTVVPPDKSDTPSSPAKQVIPPIIGTSPDAEPNCPLLMLSVT